MTTTIQWFTEGKTPLYIGGNREKVMKYLSKKLTVKYTEIGDFLWLDVPLAEEVLGLFNGKHKTE